MVRTLRPFILLVLLASPAWGADPTIEGPDKSPPHRLVRLRLEGDFDSAIWLLEPFEVVDAEPGPEGRSVLFAAPPGTYIARAVTIKDKTLAQARHVVTIEGTGPQPQPQPGPQPGPQPQPGPLPPGIEGLGRQFGPELAAAYADGWDAAASALAAGLTLQQAQEAMQAKYKEVAGASFGARVMPAFAAVIPDRTEPKDQAQRDTIAAMWRDFAKGLRGVK